LITDAEYRKILQEGLRLFNEHKFFECHDKLEEAWKEVKHEKKKEPGSDPRRDFTHGLILLAVAYHHWRNGNPIGTIRKYDESKALLAPYPATFEGVDLATLKSATKRVFEAVRKTPKRPFDPGSVPVLAVAA
jgi:predicted metal-dependent hydrolase